MHQNGHLKSLYPRALSVQAYKRQNCFGDWPKVVNSGSLGLSNLAVQGTHFEPTVWILPVKSTAEIFYPAKTNLPSSIPINKSRFHVRREKKIECKVDKKSAFLPCFHIFLLSSSQPHIRPPPFSPSSVPLQSASHSDTQQPHVVAASLLSFSLSSLRNSFSLSTTTTPAVAANTLSSDFHPYQQQQRRRFSPHLLQP